MIKITNKGFRGQGIYIGRSRKRNIFGNPFPVKQSKFSDKVYSLEESLRLYRKYFEDNVLNTQEFKRLIEEYKETGYLVLDCWCINKTIKSLEEINLSECKCHGEIFAYYILREIEKDEEDV